MDEPHQGDGIALLLPGGLARLVPELDVRDLSDSLAFWRGTLGFRIAYARPEDRFAFMERDGGQVMLCQVNGNWETAPLERPHGRGVNIQIVVRAITPLLDALAARSWPLFRGPHDVWYRADNSEIGLRQFLVQDPDGYLLRFAECLGTRGITPAGSASSR